MTGRRGYDESNILVRGFVLLAVIGGGDLWTMRGWSDWQSHHDELRDAEDSGER